MDNPTPFKWRHFEAEIILLCPRGAQRDRLWSSKRLLEPKRSGRVYTFV